MTFDDWASADFSEFGFAPGPIFGSLSGMDVYAAHLEHSRMDEVRYLRPRRNPALLSRSHW